MSRWGLPSIVLKPVDTPLYGFFDHSIQPHGGVELLVIAGSHLAQATMLSNFLIVDILRVYNAIIGRPTLNTLQVVAFTYHLTLKFPTLVGIGVRKNQVESAAVVPWL